jgi:hypothetical protein
VFKSPENTKPCRQKLLSDKQIKLLSDKQIKLLSDKQIKFKDFCVSWNTFHKNLPRDSFKIFFWKNMELYEIQQKKCI